jgi:hypothetical protein
MTNLAGIPGLSFCGVIISAPPLDSGFRRNGLERCWIPAGGGMVSKRNRSGEIEKPEWMGKNELAMRMDICVRLAGQLSNTFALTRLC